MTRSPGTPPSPIDRRAVLAGLGASALAPVQPARGQPIHLLQAKPDILRLGAGQQDTPIWSLVWPSGGPDVRFRRGQTVHVAFANDLPVPIAPSWLGLDGARAIEPLTAHQALAAGAKESFEIPLSRAGTLLCDPGLLAEGQTRPMRGLPLIVAETEAVGVDRDEVLLIERWQLRADGTAVAPGSEPKDTLPVYAINGQPSLEITARRH